MSIIDLKIRENFFKNDQFLTDFQILNCVILNFKYFTAVKNQKTTINQNISQLMSIKAPFMLITSQGSTTKQLMNSSC